MAVINKDESEWAMIRVPSIRLCVRPSGVLVDVADVFCSLERTKSQKLLANVRPRTHSPSHLDQEKGNILNF